jgi:hypothetical protein
MICVPFTIKWIIKKIKYFIDNTLVIKGMKYHTIKKNIKSRLCFLCFELSEERILVLKNYYRKNHVIICIKPILGTKNIVICKHNNEKPIWSFMDKKINIFRYYRKKEG